MEMTEKEIDIPEYFTDFLKKDTTEGSIENLIQRIITLHYQYKKKAIEDQYILEKLNNFIEKPYLINNDNYRLFHLKTLSSNCFDTEYQTSLRRLVDVLK